MIITTVANNLVNTYHWRGSWSTSSIGNCDTYDLSRYFNCGKHLIPHIAESYDYIFTIRNWGSNPLSGLSGTAIIRDTRNWFSQWGAYFSLGRIYELHYFLDSYCGRSCHSLW
jgi:hypothetical protein